jgi:hypothetical protein
MAMRTAGQVSYRVTAAMVAGAIALGIFFIELVVKGFG